MNNQQRLLEMPLSDARAVEPLIRALSDEDSLVRRVAAYALGQFRDKRAIQPLIAAFDDETFGVRLSASLALGQIGACAVEPLLHASINGYSNEAEHALRTMNDAPRVLISPLLAALKHEDRRMRVVAAKFLMHVDDQMHRVIPALRKALADPDGEVRHYAKVTLSVLEEKCCERSPEIQPFATSSISQG